MTWQEIKDFVGIISGLIGVAIGAWLAPFVTARLEDAKLKRRLKPDLVKSLFAYYRLLKEKAEIVNTLSMDERAATLISEKLLNQPSNPTDLEKKLNILTEKITRKNLQHDPVVHGLLDVESTIHSIVAQIGTYFKADKYNNCIDVLNPFFKRLERAPYLHDYIALTETEYNDLVGPQLQKQIIAFGKTLDDERAEIINKLVHLEL